MNRWLLCSAVAFGLVVSSTVACTEDEVKLYDPETFAIVGHSDKDHKEYKLDSGKSFSINVDQRVFLNKEKAVPVAKNLETAISPEELKAKVARLDASLKEMQKPSTGNKAGKMAGGRECWLMHEGGVGCFGCYTPSTGGVFEYCWDYQ